MGCDIHWFVETRDDEGTWHAAEMPRAYLEQYDGGWWLQYEDSHPIEGDSDDDRRYADYRKLCWRIHRNYRLFDALNGVRCRNLSTGLTAKGRFWYQQGDTEDHSHDIIGRLFGPSLDEFGHHVDWPFNVSDRVKAQMWDDDGHSYCWTQLKNLQDERLAEAGGDSYILLMKFMQELNEDPMHVRALWFYDN